MTPNATPDPPGACLYCLNQTCKQSSVGTLSVCEYGVTYYHGADTLVRRETVTPMRSISTNLRHELHPVLALIVQEAMKLDPTITKRHIDVDRPASRILGASIVIDHVIQMITGVNEFHHSPSADASNRKERRLSETIQKYFDIYSIVRSARRADHLQLHLEFDHRILVTHAIDVVDYLVAVVMDNVWKYSIPGTTVQVDAVLAADDTADVSFVNVSKPIPENLDLFSPGIQASSDAKGFGYGLFWATVLVQHYNGGATDPRYLLRITHEQSVVDLDRAVQTFTFKNLRVRQH